MRSTAFLTLVATAALTATGCSSSATGTSRPHVTPPRGVGQASTPTSPPQLRDACGLLTDAQLAAATNTTVHGHAQQAAPSYQSVCQWTLSSSEPRDVGDPDVKVTLEQDDDLGAGMDTFADDTRDFDPVPGLGEKAATGQQGGIGPVEVVVLDHGLVYTVQVNVSDYPDQNVQFGEALARLAVAAG